MHRVFLKNNGMRRLYLIGFHPMKDFVAVTGGENDITWIPFLELIQNYTEEKN
jgi:hypothetical protein